MYNGIGLTTPRGSGTSGYVQRNLSALRVHEKNNDKSSWDIAPPRHREPDEAILEHERKRKVEVKCLELELELEEKEVDEVEIERLVDELRQKLLANLAAEANSARRTFKPSDTHAMAVAKKTELDKMARALGTRGDYQEGDAFDREKQEEARQRRIIEREEREKERLEKAKKREEDRKRMEEQRKRWQEERRKKEEERSKKDEEEREKRRNREDGDRKRDDRGAMPPPDIPRREQPSRDRDREFSRRSPPHKYGPRGDRRDPPPRPSAHVAEAVRKRDRDSHSRSHSRSPQPRARRRVHSRSPSTSRSASTDSGIRRRRSASKSPSRLPQRGKEETYSRDTFRDRGDGRHRDLPPRRSPSPMRGFRRGGRRVSRSASPPSRSRSPPPRNARRRDDVRSLRSRSRSPRVAGRLGPIGKGKRGYTPRTPSRSPTPPPPTRRERVEQLTPTTGPIYDGLKGVQRGKERGRTRSRSASSGSSMSVSSRSASGSRSG